MVLEKFRNMVKKILTIIGLIILVSCHLTLNNKENKELYSWVLKNEQLKEQILSYIDSVKTPEVKGKFVELMYQTMSDTTYKYTLYYKVDTYGLVFDPPLLFFDVEGNMVGLSIIGINDFALKEQLLLDIVKDRFPKEYEYYQLNNDYAPPTTSRSIIWELTFVKDSLTREGRLIKKEVIRYF